MKQLLYIDLFCGAGGTSTGVERAYHNNEKCARVIACVNHDKNAIASHAANHPGALHYTEDIRTLDLVPLQRHVAAERKANPGAFVVLWASLECTNFSKAKGGQPRNADSRTLAEHLYRYIEMLQPDYIYIENVVEFMCWGDLDSNGKPISRDKGRLYMRWLKTICEYGYDFSHRILNSANFGAYTSRTRYFGIFAKHGLPIVFPEPTHCKSGQKGLFGNLQKWKAVKDVLELEDEGRSIFVREKPLSDKTLERIYAGLVKFVAGGKSAFLSRYNSVRPCDTALSMEEPCGVITTENRFAKVKCCFLSKQYSGEPYSNNITIEEPCGAITTIDHHAVVSTKFLDAYYGNGFETSIETPAPTLTTSDRFSIVTAEKFILNPQYQSPGGSLENPCFTLIARMDKMPPYLVSTKKGDISIVIYDSDTPSMRKIKIFMATYGIVDIKMRMLNVGELKRIMGFGTDYTLIGTQTEQKKYIGNAVEVNMSKALCVALYKELFCK